MDGPTMVFEGMTDLLTVYASEMLDWTKIARSNLRVISQRSTGESGPFKFFEKTLASTIEEYDRREEAIRKEFKQQLATWQEYFIKNKLVEANIKTAIEAAMQAKRVEVKHFVAETNAVAKEWLAKCDSLGYSGDYRAMLLSDQTPVETMVQFIIHE